MATYKRHVIYLSDEEWKEIKSHAQDADTTMSAYIRSRLVDGPVPTMTLTELGSTLGIDTDERIIFDTTPMRDATPEQIARTHTAQAQRDAILRKINRPAAERPKRK